MQIRKQGHCAYRCEYHLVLVSKYRHKIFNDGSFKYFQGILKQVWENIPEVKLLTINHDTDHIHMHLSILPKVRVSDVVRTVNAPRGLPRGAFT
ncbi:IS200/IS605 family transposase [Rickettsia endosymbiont of Gonocerus acuteangulatus]|uniref:IS200/IS605 family transposase n=1 Tax=Rickettsia endosymbiont of Gonocerus acuteangulatus TaxID=3066266 RepID=UPI00397E2A1D